jgi:hypothetical protein
MVDARSLENLQQAIRREWTEIALSTKRIDRTRAAEAVEALYRAATGRPPAAILFFDSPAQAEAAGTFFVSDFFASLPLGEGRRPPDVMLVIEKAMGIGSGAIRRPDPLGAAPHTENLVRTALDDTYLLQSAFDALCRQLPPHVRRVLPTGQRRNKNWRQRLRRQARWSVSLFWWREFAAYHCYQRAAFPHQKVPDQNLISAIIEICRTCGGCWFYPEIAIISDRPALMQFDETGRLHADTGPAVDYPDGFAVYALHGVPIARWIFEQPSKITATDVESEPNAEVRRVMVERMGPERYLSLSGAVPVSRDETGTLWRRSFIDRRSGASRDWCFVEVVNGTPEPDGSHRHYFLRVPPVMRRARDAVAWTYGLSAEEYQPRIRT